MCCLPLHALLLEKLAVAFTEVVHAPGVVLAAIERKREAADLEAHLDHIRGDHWPRLLAPRRHRPTSRGLQLARVDVGDSCGGMGGVHSLEQPLHLLVEHAVQRLEERSQPSRDQDDGGVSSFQEVIDETLVSVVLEVVQHQNTFGLLDDTSVVGAQLPPLRDPKGKLPRVTPAFLLHTKRHGPRGVPEPGKASGGNLCGDGSLLRLTALALPRPGGRDERRALEDDAQRNLAAIRHDSKTVRKALLLLACAVPNTKR